MIAKKKNKQNQQPLTWCAIDLKAVKANLRAIRQVARQNVFYLPTRPQKARKLKNVEIMPVIKADAYGHGMEEVGKLLDLQGVGFFGVSDVSEGISLRKMGIKKPILLFESSLKEYCKDIIHYSLMPTVCALDLARELNSCAKQANQRVDVHIKVDTGMGRLGIWHEEAFEIILKLHQLKNLRLLGILTHFPAADTDTAFTKKQIKGLFDVVTRLDKKGIIIPYIHAANSMGLAGYKTHILNLARPGLLLYGLYPHQSLRNKIKLKPAMSVFSKIIFLKNVAKGRSISYGRTFLTKRKMTIATIPIGYNDGYFRALSNKASVLVKGIRCPVVGRVTMDQIMVDVTNVNSPKIGERVVIMGKQKNNEVSADELSRHAGTINYEIACSLGNRLPRVYT